MGMILQVLAKTAYTGANFKKDLGNIVVTIVGAAGALMVLYAIYIAFLFASATDAGKRKAAKDRLIKVVASSIIIIGLASALAAINVTFNSAEGNFTGPTAPGTVAANSNYGYEGQATFNFLSKTDNSGVYAIGYVNFNTALLLDEKGNKIDPKGTDYAFSGCKVVQPTDWPAGCQLTESFDAAKGEYNVTVKSNSPNQYNITIPGKTVVFSLTFYKKSESNVNLVAQITATCSASGQVTFS